MQLVRGPRPAAAAAAAAPAAAGRVGLCEGVQGEVQLRIPGAERGWNGGSGGGGEGGDLCATL